MLLRRIAERLRSESWITLFLELSLVVLGILLAFQLDRAYQNSQDRDLEQRYLVRLHADLQRDTSSLTEVIGRTERRIAQVDLLLDVVDDPTVAADDPRAFASALEQVTWRSVPAITSVTYDELQTSGRSTLLRSDPLRAGLADYYTRIDVERRLGLGEDDQDRFRLATIGLLSGAHLSAIEDPERFPLELTPDEANLIAMAFSARAEAHPWLARLTKYQVLMRRLAEGYLKQAHGLLELIDQEMEGP